MEYSTGGFMVVKIRFARGTIVTRRKGKNSWAAILAASLLTLISISFASLGLWRLGTDLNWAGEFVFSDGFLSHWQVWIGAAIGIQYACWRLTRYAKAARTPKPGTALAGEPAPPARAIANV